MINHRHILPSIGTSIQGLPNRMRSKLIDAINPRNLTSRIDSFPFLACDTYALHSTVMINTEEDFYSASDFSFESAPTVYVNGNIRNYKALLSQLSFPPLKDEMQRILMVGDTDEPQEPRDFSTLISNFSKIYSVNLTYETEKIRALPIGLESQSYRSAGELKIFKKHILQNKVIKRKIGILVAWNDQTNRLKRESAREKLRMNPEVYEVKTRLPARNIHKLIRKSLFVACPVGNGKDTHRVWETLYLDAIPIMLKEDNIASESDWPIFMINDWAELVNISYKELNEMYLDNFPTIQRKFLGLQNKVFHDILNSRIHN